MNRMITAFTIFTVSLGTAAFAGTPPVPAPSNAQTAPSKTSLTYASQSSPFATGSSLFANPNVPGATGETIVPGDNSTITGDFMATQIQRTGSIGRE